MKIKSFASIATKYEAIFFDAFGVLKDYGGLIPGIDTTLRMLDEAGKEIFILTNDASRSPQALAARYQEQGVTTITPDKIISSGMLAREYIRYKVKSGAVVYLGTANSAHYLEDLGIQCHSIKDIHLDDADQYNALVLLDEEGFDWNHDLSKTINLLRRKNLPVVVANTDRTYPVSRHQLNIAIGGVANMLEDIIGRRFIRFGKPDAQMFLFAYEHLQQRRTITKNKILMVGDTLHTDILGGNKFGLATALVLSGNTLPDHYKFLINSTGIIPDYVCESAVMEQ
ncbi:MAG: HAD-IIA family hydrolase [Lewinellaceae bacterium]|nr:HAD-IIA family hydrolase [Lewinellaceae bacterium]